MKTCVGYLIWLALLLLPVSQACAQDPGVADTVRVHCPVHIAAPGDSFPVPIYLWNDEQIYGFSLGFSCNTEIYRLVGASEVGGIIPPGPRPLCLCYHAPDSGRILLSWFNFDTTTYITPSPDSVGRLLMTIYMMIRPQTPATAFSLDSTFIPPASRFALYPYGVQAISPQYVNCEFFWDDIGEDFPGIDQSGAEGLPTSYSLRQNCPNPFNPNTVISFAIPKPTHVSIEVFNVLGQSVRTLLEESVGAGYKQVVWDGTDHKGREVPTGVYLYRLSANNFVDTKKMVFLK